MGKGHTMWVGACLAAVIAAGPAHAQDAGAPPPERPRTIVFTPDRAERCQWFFVTEFDASFAGGSSQDPIDRLLFTDAIGIMRNVGRSSALGVSLDVHLGNGNFAATPSIRFKQWLAGRSSVELVVGFAADDLEKEGVVGPIGSVRYSPTPWFHVQAGASRIRNVHSIRYFPDYSVNEESPVRFHAGVGLGGVPAVISWGAQAVGFAVLASMFSGMS